MRETELYEPVKKYLESHGYRVKAEVVNCDLAATKGDELIIVELKPAANMRLLIQATDRQQTADSVYVGIPAPSKRNNHWRGIKRVLKQLELGLLVVNFGPMGAHVEKELDPLPGKPGRSGKKRRAVITELSERSGDYNIAGSTGRKLMTAYRENAILIACCLARFGPMSPRALRELGTGQRTLGILSNNHYGWFQRVDRGIYQITAQGIEDLKSYPEICTKSNDFIDKDV